MYAPTLFRDRPRPVQVILGGVVPLMIGAVAGIMVGIAPGAYWAVAAIAAVGGVLAGFEHRDGWGGADRGLVGGALYGPAEVHGRRRRGGRDARADRGFDPGGPNPVDDAPQPEPWARAPMISRSQARSASDSAPASRRRAAAWTVRDEPTETVRPQRA